MIRRGVTSALAAGAMILTALVATSPSATAAINPSVIGTSAATAAGSCWEIKQLRPSATDGAYWLLTPKMVEPQQFYCDMTTDGGGWVLIGKGREGWTNEYQGKGSASDLLTPTLSPMSSVTTQLGGDTINALLNGGRVDALSEGIRLRRATNTTGTSWQEVRFKLSSRDRWAWTFGAEHTLGTWSFDNSTGSGGTTPSFGSNNSTRRVVNTTAQAQTYKLGFAFGSQVSGSNSDTTYLWSATNGGGGALPYTMVYLRPRVLSTDAGFTAIPDGGLGQKVNISVAKNNAISPPWGVAGMAGAVSIEGSVEVQAFTQSGNNMYVGGNFAYVQRDEAGTDRVDQPFLAAFDVTTGELVQSFRPVLNEQVRALTTLPNGNVVAGGDFTQANGVAVGAMVVLDPTTGATVPGWNTKVLQNGTTNPLRVWTLQAAHGWIYVGGTFTHLQGGTKPNVQVAAKNLGRMDSATFTPDTTWLPKPNAGVEALDASDDGTRLYAAGHFTIVTGVSAVSAAVISTSSGAAVTPWAPVWSASKTYQQAIDEVGGRLWVGGSEHNLFSYDTPTLNRLSGNIFQKNGDIQGITDDRGVVYAGCHCNNFNYSNAFRWTTPVPAGWTQADALNWFGAWDANTGQVIQQFTPSFRMRLGSGIWALQADTTGTLWAGGDIEAVRTGTKAAAWAGGFARFARTDTEPPPVPTNLRVSSYDDTSVSLAWGANGAGGSTRYLVLRDDRPIATTSATSITVPRGGSDRYFVRSIDTDGNASATTSVTALPANTKPTAAFSSTVDATGAHFDGSGSSDPDGSVVNWSWSFGDGGTGSGQNVDHVYAAPGTYQVTLTVLDNLGATASVTNPVVISSGIQTQVKIARLSGWAWYYAGTAPPAGWNTNGFDDSAWSTGNAVLGFPSTAVATNIDTFATTSLRAKTAYFRKTFQVADVSKVTRLAITAVANDGAVVYVNGVEVARQNMPAGTITFDTFASTARSAATANANPIVVDIPLNLLVDGTNTVSVETHLNYRNTPDVTFDLDATAYVNQ